MTVQQNTFRMPEDENNNSGSSGQGGNNQTQGDGTGTVIKPGEGEDERDTTVWPLSNMTGPIDRRVSRSCLNKLTYHLWKVFHLKF